MKTCGNLASYKFPYTEHFSKILNWVYSIDCKGSFNVYSSIESTVPSFIQYNIFVSPLTHAFLLWGEVGTLELYQYTFWGNSLINKRWKSGPDPVIELLFRSDHMRVIGSLVYVSGLSSFRLYCTTNGSLQDGLCTVAVIEAKLNGLFCFNPLNTHIYLIRVLICHTAQVTNFDKEHPVVLITKLKFFIYCCALNEIKIYIYTLISVRAQQYLWYI